MLVWFSRMRRVLTSLKALDGMAVQGGEGGSRCSEELVRPRRVRGGPRDRQELQVDDAGKGVFALDTWTRWDCVKVLKPLYKYAVCSAWVANRPAETSPNSRGRRLIL